MLSNSIKLFCVPVPAPLPSLGSVTFISSLPEDEDEDEGWREEEEEQAEEINSPAEVSAPLVPMVVAVLTLWGIISWR
jgi:hypothetical protein